LRSSGLLDRADCTQDHLTDILSGRGCSLVYRREQPPSDAARRELCARPVRPGTQALLASPVGAVERAGLQVSLQLLKVADKVIRTGAAP
jgi:hypothetical protein